ncbi:unnamed protein product [Cylindrotheca closterium]|uniref:Uncharacterized protein n=1 Tax=Cylindrotheca closterium TaxID=2856 RepID=A0AAD2FLF8_9STRA|nr:unnamed protein product [Cylindrotheca closterium]
MGKEYIDKVTSNDILWTKNGREKKAHAGNKLFWKIVEGAFNDHRRNSSNLMMAFHIVDKLEEFDPPMRLLQFDKDVGKYYKCSTSNAWQRIQQAFNSLESSTAPDKTKKRAAKAMTKRIITGAKVSRQYEDDQDSNPKQKSATPQPTKESTDNLPPAIVSPNQLQDEEETTWHLPENEAIIPPLPQNRDETNVQKIPITATVGNHASSEMELDWPEEQDDQAVVKVYVDEHDFTESDILYRGRRRGKKADIDLPSDAFRICLQETFRKYQDSCQGDPSAKRRFHLSVLYGLRQLNPDIRFLKYNEAVGKFHEWNHREAIEMILLEMEGQSKPRPVATTPQEDDTSNNTISSPSLPIALDQPQVKLPVSRTTPATIEIADGNGEGEQHAVLHEEDMDAPANNNLETRKCHNPGVDGASQADYLEEEEEEEYDEEEENKHMEEMNRAMELGLCDSSSCDTSEDEAEPDTEIVNVVEWTNPSHDIICID